MSSILNALKKLEKNSPAPSEKVDRPAWLGGSSEKRSEPGSLPLVDPHQVLGPKNRSLGFVGKIVAAAVFMGIALGGMAAWNALNPETDSAQPQLLTAKPKASPLEEKKAGEMAGEKAGKKAAVPKPSETEAEPIPEPLPKPGLETAAASLSKPISRESSKTLKPRLMPRAAAAPGETGRAAPSNPFVANRPKAVFPQQKSPQENPIREAAKVPIRTDPIRTDPIRTEPIRSDPTRTEPKIALSDLKQVESQARRISAEETAFEEITLEMTPLEKREPALPEPNLEMDIAAAEADPLPLPAPEPVASPRQDLAAISEVFETVEQRSDPRFLIQALVWAQDPVARMAMVNGRMVKIGSFIDGVSVRHIGNDFILFEEGENRWKHPFRVQ